MSKCKYANCPIPASVGKRRCEKHLEQMRGYGRAWRERNPLNGMEWKRNNPEKVARYHRTTNHRLFPEDELRFIAARQGNIPCDWCGVHFTPNDVIHIDHDRLCCKGLPSCGHCTRGMTHLLCNTHSIFAYELVAEECGFVAPKLAAYKARFPRKS